jgi:hypothetical protein
MTFAAADNEIPGFGIPFQSTRHPIPNQLEIRRGNDPNEKQLPRNTKSTRSDATGIVSIISSWAIGVHLVLDACDWLL